MRDQKNNRKYKNMLEANKVINQAKEELAISFIAELKKSGKSMSIMSMARETGLSASFFYKNKTVRALVDSLAKKDKQANLLEIKKAEVFNKANLKKIEVLEELVQRQNEEIQRLKKGHENGKDSLHI